MPDSKLTKGSVNRLLNWLPEVDAAVIGPGLESPDDEALRNLVIELGLRKTKIILDAGALQPSLKPAVRGKNIIVTPHAGEFKRFFSVQLPLSLEDRSVEVEKIAKESEIVILQKGHGDVISDGKETFLNRTGRAAMTVGGTGDVLAGLTAGFAALNIPLVFAAAMAAYANGIAGNNVWMKVGNRITAEELATELKYVLKNFDKEDI